MSDRESPDALRKVLQSVRRRLRGLTLAVIVLALMVTVNFAGQFGALVDWHAYDPLLYGGATAGAAVLGFIAGWIARRSA